jgi:hypothetical protein
MADTVCVYNTDPDWIAALQANNVTTNANFWRKDRRTVHLEPGSYFYFKLRGGLRIAGRGAFRAQEEMSLDDAWNRFGHGNGANSRGEFERRARDVLKLDAGQAVNCIILDDLEIIPGEQPELATSDWPRGIMGGKYFRAEALSYLDPYFVPVSTDAVELVAEQLASEGFFDPAAILDARQRALRAIAMRRGQPQFRQALFHAYGDRCAVSGTDQAETLEAAHIFPYAGVETNRVQNGLLLRADLHTMFDLGLWTVMPDFRVRLATSVRSSFYM